MTKRVSRPRTRVRRSPSKKGPARLNRWRVLGVGIRKRNIGLVMGALGLRKGIRRIHVPQSYGVENQRFRK